jgi:hypothetical protein
MRPVVAVATFAVSLAVLFATYQSRTHIFSSSTPTRLYQPSTVSETLAQAVPLDPDGNTQGEQVVEQLRAKLGIPHDLLRTSDTEEGPVQPRQFLHLHHMKTGGTSMDGLIRCAMQRYRSQHGTLPYQNIHECSAARYARCLSGDDTQCVGKVQEAAIMSYCAPLRDLTTFQWTRTTSGGSDNGEEGGIVPSTDTTPIRAVTVLRHPVDRVWSMYRFRTKACYGCRDLKDVYAEIDSGNSTLDRMCALQLQNHQTNNLLSSTNFNETTIATARGTPQQRQQIISEAIRNMHDFFTMVGLTEELNTTAAMVGRVFPWLATDVNGTVCGLPHSNASPQNNHCGSRTGNARDRSGSTHWDLPSRPDDATAQLIRKHNELDMALYEAAVDLFRLQKEALGL